MTDQPLHKQHLESAQQQQQQLVAEIQELQNQITSKRELVLKVQGVIEYLQQIEGYEFYSIQGRGFLGKGLLGKTISLYFFALALVKSSILLINLLMRLL